MIDIKKQYRTLNGFPVRLYAVDGVTLYPIHGAMKLQAGWMIAQWNEEGNHYADMENLSLVEVPKRIRQTVYLNIYDDSCNNYVSVRYSKENALDKAEDGLVACVQVDIDVEEGHGL